MVFVNASGFPRGTLSSDGQKSRVAHRGLRVHTAVLEGLDAQRVITSLEAKASEGGIVLTANEPAKTLNGMFEQGIY